MMRSTRRAVVVAVVDTVGEAAVMALVMIAVVTAVPRRAVRMTIRAAVRGGPAKGLPLRERNPVAVCLLRGATMAVGRQQAPVPPNAVPCIAPMGVARRPPPSRRYR